jgi:hypothetical protein
MQKRTAAKVADLLGLAEAWLRTGRPRKLPGRPRAEATMYGLTTKVTTRNVFDCEKVSLVGAFKAARIEQGYTRTIQKYAEDALAKVAYPWTYEALGLQGIDDLENDTRQLIRDLRAARKNIERQYLS